MASSFLDPVTNAGSVGFLFILSGGIRLLGGLAGLSISIRAMSIPLLIVSFMAIAINTVTIIMGIGLMKRKLWGVKFLGITSLITLITMLIEEILVKPVGMLDIISLVIQVILFIWFWSAKERFNGKV